MVSIYDDFGFETQVEKIHAPEIIGIYRKISRLYDEQYNPVQGRWSSIRIYKRKVSDDYILLGVSSLKPIINSTDLSILAAVSLNYVRLYQPLAKKLGKIYILRDPTMTFDVTIKR